jgi:hypothetical protein
MTSFNDREKAFEGKFKLDQDLQFKVKSRRNKLVGLWAAAKLGLDGAAADAYAKEVVAADFEKAGDDDVVQKVLGDFKAKGVSASAADITAELERQMAVAKSQIASELK